MNFQVQDLGNFEPSPMIKIDTIKRGCSIVFNER